MVMTTRNAETPSVRLIPTEVAVTGFQLATGVFGGLAAIVAARRLAGIEGGQISLKQLIPAIAVAGASTVAGAFLLPTG